MINTIIIDDEQQPRETIAQLLALKYPEIQIVAQANSVKNGFDAIKRHKPELVFLDIDLGDGSGFDLLEKLKPIDFKLIFATGFSEFAIQAFRFSALDYILKPIKSTELFAATEKAISQIKLSNQSVKIEALFSNFQNIAHESKKIVLKTQKSIYLVNIQNIIRCESDNAYVTFYLNDGRRIVVSNSLKEYEEMLMPLGFYRTHQSHLINMNCIVRFDKRNGGFIVMTDKSQVPVSQRKRHELFELFETM